MSSTNHEPAGFEDALIHSWTISQHGPQIQQFMDQNRDRDMFDILHLEPDALRRVLPGDPAPSTPDIAEMRDILDRHDVTAITQNDPRYPRQLLDTLAAPPVLYCRGHLTLLEEQLETNIAVVGSRKATGYGLEAAHRIGSQLAHIGLTIVSGMGLGIEGSAHRGALESGPTIAVLPCGVDRAYPATHTRLHQQIIEKGLVISEQPPGANAWRWTFPARNRIIVGLANTTVVVEGQPRSGAENTAGMARAINRTVCAVPGPITAMNSAVPNQLIRNGVAQLVTCPTDIRDINSTYAVF